jgi:RHS repeat-associated protein
VDFPYDNLDRLTLAEYSVTEDRNEETNRYDKTGTADISCSYDNAGNTTIDQDGYEYSYDYENRIIRIEDSSNTVAEFEYDALGRRIYRYDAIAYEDTFYYYNTAWQVLSEYDDSTHKMSYIYGNYIDEVLVRFVGSACKYFVHDHLYSPVALAASDGSLIERYEYDAYGNCHILDPSSYAPKTSSIYNDTILFTGRRLDILDNGSLKLQYNRNRYYDRYTGRWLTNDPFRPA